MIPIYWILLCPAILFLLYFSHLLMRTHTHTHSYTSEYFLLSFLSGISSASLYFKYSMCVLVVHVCTLLSMTFGLLRRSSILSMHRTHKRKRVFNHSNKSPTCASDTCCLCTNTFLSCPTGIWNSSNTKLFLMNAPMADCGWVYFSLLLVIVIVISVCYTRLNFYSRLSNIGAFSVWYSFVVIVFDFVNLKFYFCIFIFIHGHII